MSGTGISERRCSLAAISTRDGPRRVGWWTLGSARSTKSTKSLESEKPAGRYPRTDLESDRASSHGQGGRDEEAISSDLTTTAGCRLIRGRVGDGPRRPVAKDGPGGEGGEEWVFLPSRDEQGGQACVAPVASSPRRSGSPSRWRRPWNCGPSSR